MTRTGFESVLSKFDHFCHAVPAQDIDCLGGADGVAASGTGQLSSAGFLRGGSCGVSSVSAASGSGVVLQSTGHLDVLPALLEDVGEGVIGDGGDCPPIAGVMLDVQPVGLGGGFESLVVVGVTPAAILDPVLEVPEVCHLVQEGADDILDGALQRVGSDV